METQGQFTFVEINNQDIASQRRRRLALATALYDAGLAPRNVQRQEYRDGTIFWWGDAKKWQPWADIAAVWHLILRFRISIIPSHGKFDTWCVEGNDSAVEVSGNRIAEAVANLALYLLRKGEA